MKIALDYDRTYTLDPDFWDDFVYEAKSRGHSVVVITARVDPDDLIEHEMPCHVIYCNGKAKNLLYKADVWIDDNPLGILEDSKFTKAQLEEWRSLGRP